MVSPPTELDLVTSASAIVFRFQQTAADGPSGLLIRYIPGMLCGGLVQVVVASDHSLGSRDLDLPLPDPAKTDTASSI